MTDFTPATPPAGPPRLALTELFESSDSDMRIACVESYMNAFQGVHALLQTIESSDFIAGGNDEILRYLRANDLLGGVLTALTPKGKEADHLNTISMLRAILSIMTVKFRDYIHRECNHD